MESVSSKRNYYVYFELYGRKMKATAFAESEEDAKQQIMNKIIFHKVEKKPGDEFNDVIEMMDDTLEFLSKTVKK